MLVLTEALRDEIIAHAREQHPVEACGIIAGPPAGRPTRLIRMHNATGSEWAYQFDPAQQVAAFADMDQRGEDPLVIYHSHSYTAAIPSGTDTRYATLPDAHYLIVSLADNEEQPELRAWLLTGNPYPGLRGLSAWREDELIIGQTHASPAPSAP